MAPLPSELCGAQGVSYENGTRTETPMTQKKTAPDHQADNPKANPSTDSNQIKNPSDWVTIAAR